VSTVSSADLVAQRLDIETADTQIEGREGLPAEVRWRLLP
jgi:hypothetical protein